MRICSIILARGGSKGLPNKNILEFSGKPLLAWTIEHCIDAGINDVYVSSDCNQILNSACEYGAKKILRPHDLSGDHASAESGWLHALSEIETQQGCVDWVLAPQVTSPLREPSDIKQGLEVLSTNNFDSLFSCSIVEDLFMWEKQQSGCYQSINYNWENRQRRQDNKPQVVENGSFYFFKPNDFRKHNNRLSGRIGTVEMEFWKMFEIDSLQDFRMCSSLMNEFLVNKK